VFSLPQAHWRRTAAANPIERAIQQELERRTRKIRVFPNQAALERLARPSSSTSTKKGWPPNEPTTP
jgi:transposase-like protein